MHAAQQLNQASKAYQGTGISGAATPAYPSLTAKCGQMEDRVRSLMQALYELDDVAARLIGRDAPSSGGKAEANEKVMPPIDLRFAQGLEDLASAEGFLRTLTKRLDVAI